MKKPCSECGFVHRAYCKAKPVKARIVDEIARLEFEQFRHPDEEGRLRVLEIRELAIRQLSDDVFTVIRRGERIRGNWVLTRDMGRWDSEQDARPFYPIYTEEDEALQLALEPFLDQLTPDERALERLYFDAQETQTQIAERFGVKQKTISVRLSQIYKKLREALLAELGPQEEVTLDE